MKQEIKILIIDGRHTFIQGIKTTLLTNKIVNNSINIKAAYSYEESLSINNMCRNRENKFDILIIGVDISFTNSGGMVFGEIYMNRLRGLYPNTKIITVILTKDNYRIYHIVQKIRPDGFFVENELDLKNLHIAITSVIRCKRSYSKSINSIVQKNNRFSNMFDDIDREILYYLDRGIKTKDLYKYVLRSQSTIEKRKHKMKDILGLIQGMDKELIKEAKLRALI